MDGQRGGFSAGPAALNVNVGGASGTVTWGTTVGTNLVGTLVLSSPTAANVTTFQNPIVWEPQSARFESTTTRRPPPTTPSSGRRFGNRRPHEDGALPWRSPRQYLTAAPRPSSSVLCRPTMRLD